MEAFAYAEKVRLRSAWRGTYLSAGEGLSSRVVQRRNAAADDASCIWEVKPVKRSSKDEQEEVRLRSCYGGYLTASSSSLSLLWPCSSRAVIQTNPTRADELSEWAPLRRGDGFLIRLRSRAATFLRARRCSCAVTHGHDDGDDELWEVEIVKEKMDS